MEIGKENRPEFYKRNIHEIIKKLLENLAQHNESKMQMEDDEQSHSGPLPSNTFKEMTDLVMSNKSIKKILIWNDFFGDMSYGFGLGREPFIQYGCPVNTCVLTADRKRYPTQELDAIIFHYRGQDLSLPQERSLHTRLIFFLMESPAYINKQGLRGFQNSFNWTMTYRRDADVYNPYGFVFRRKRPTPQHPPGYNYSFKKTKMAAWFVSNCGTDSDRQTLVKSMKKYMPVDVYGACGPFKCERDQNNSCYTSLARDYKFYLSFENSLCNDYVTEKFFIPLQYDVVPVVYGLGNYKDIAPPHSYIDVLDFPSVKALTDYLIYLHSNDTAYNEYFEWKTHSRARVWMPMGEPHGNFCPWCQLCAKLHADNTTKVVDIYDWYVSKAHCQPPSKYQLFINGL